nr:hypothetical protein [Tanacetum cinerariifolium]
GEPVPTLPFVTSSVSATPEREDRSPADYVHGPNLRTIGAPQRFVISSDYSYHSGANIAEAEVDSIISRICREMLYEFAPPKFLASVRGMDHDQLFTEFNVGAARQISLKAKVRMRAEYNIREKRKLRAVVDEQAELLKIKDEEIESLKAQLLLKEAEAAKAIRLRAELEEVNENFDKLCADFVEMALHLEEKIYPHLLTTISGRWWLLTYSMELAVAKCLNSTEYLSALGAAISKAIEKGMQEGLSARITHGAE